MAQSVEHVIGNDEVISSILITSSKKAFAIVSAFLFLFFGVKPFTSGVPFFAAKQSAVQIGRIANSTAAIKKSRPYP